MTPLVWTPDDPGQNETKITDGDRKQHRWGDQTVKDQHAVRVCVISLTPSLLKK